MRKLWMRLGVSLEITEAEESAIFCGDYADTEAALAKIIADGRARPDGDSYIPAVCIEDFNEAYGTDYCTEDLGVEMGGAITWTKRKSFKCFIATVISTLRTIFSDFKKKSRTGRAVYGR